MDLTVDALLAAMKRKSNLPLGTSAKFSDTQILAIAYEVLIKQVDPILLTLQEEYGVVREEFAITALDGTYRLPERCISGTITQALILDTNGDPFPLTRIGPSESWRYEGPSARAATPGAFTLEGDTIRLLPVPTASGLTLRLRYRLRPSALVLTTACGLVTSVVGQVVNATGGTFGASPTVDVVRAKPPSGLLVQQQATTYLAGAFTFGAGVDLTGITAGDYVCAYDTTCIVPLPERFIMLFVDLATAQLQEEWGKRDDAATTRAGVDTYLTRLQTAQSNRVGAQPTLVIQRGGALRGGFGFRRRF